MTFKFTRQTFFHWSRITCGHGSSQKRLVIAGICVLMVFRLSAQRLALSPYAGLEAESIQVAESSIVGDLTVTGRASESIDWTFGLRGSYYINEDYRIDLDVNKRTDYIYGYQITHPQPDSPNYGVKETNIRSYEWLISLMMSRSLLSVGDLRITASAGAGVTRITRFKPFVSMDGPDFGAGNEATTELWKVLNEVPTRSAWLGMVGAEIAYYNLWLNLRYARCLARSLTDTYTFRGETYPNRNNRHSAQLLLGYRFIIK